MTINVIHPPLFLLHSGVACLMNNLVHF